MNASSLFHEYNQNVRAVLVDFQFIEECLRLYLVSTYEHIRRCLRGSMPFKMDYGDVERDALGTLISKFDKVSNDAALIAELRDLVQHRNGAAHRGYLLTSEEQQDSGFLAQQINEISRVKKRTKPCVERLMKGLQQLEDMRKTMPSSAQ